MLCIIVYHIEQIADARKLDAQGRCALRQRLACLLYTSTYKNIELIISDDCSKDDTIKICEEWLKEKRN